MKEQSMTRILQNERGMALAIAIFALVVVGALVAGAFFAGTQEQRVGENQRRVQQSFGVAEAGAAERVRTWKPDSLNRRPVYNAAVAPTDSVVIGPNLAAPGGTGTYGGVSYKVGNALFLIDVTGRDTRTASGATGIGGGARQRLGLITRLDPVDFNIKASLTTQGNVSVQGNAQVVGVDQNPTGWGNCSGALQNQAGIRVDSGTVTTGGNGTVAGTPPVVRDTSLSDASFTNFGGTTYAQLAARANIVLPGGNYKTFPTFAGAACDKANLTNWGDGMNPGTDCGGYFPIIHITGTATLNGDQGQGILLVDGNLNVQGSYQFFGIVIIQGELKTAGGGNTEAHFWGGVMAKNASLDTQNLSGKATLNYSSCSLLTVLQATSVTAMMRSRGWTQLY
jgi:hypothetical protein